MKNKESFNDLYGSYIIGLSYSIIFAIILFLLCFLIDDIWLDYPLTYIFVAILCVAFFISGLKRVKEKNIGILRKFGRRDFEESFSEGLWWVFPLWSFKQKPHYDLLNEAEEFNVNYITSDEIPLDINIKYYWQLINIKDIDNKYTPSYIKDKLKHELGLFVRKHQAIELLTDQNIANKVMENYLITFGKNIGINISDVFPNINYESQYIPVVRKYQEKYKELKYQLDDLLMHQKVKAADMKLYESQVINCIDNLKFSSNEAMNFIKIYKNQVNLDENTYNVNIGELNNIIDSVISFLKSKQ